MNDPGGPARDHRCELAAGREEALAALAEVAEGWGAEWTRQGTGGELALPILAGLRRGWVRAEVTTESLGERTAVRLTVGERHERLQVAAIVILLVSAAGGALTALWPFFPGLLPLAPFGALLALSGWFLVVSRLRSSGPEEFLELVAEVVAEGGQPPG